VSETQLSDKARMERLLNAETIGHMALAVDNEAYVVPINFAYVDGRILFHCALQGKKLDMIRANPQVCFTVSIEEGYPVEHKEDNCDAPFEGVICFGTARVIDDLEERIVLLNEFQARFCTDLNPRKPIGEERAAKCGAVEIKVQRMTGRRFQGKEKLFWEWAEGA
jgi:uncharacterized protein